MEGKNMMRKVVTKLINPHKAQIRAKISSTIDDLFGEWRETADMIISLKEV